MCARQVLFNKSTSCRCSQDATASVSTGGQLVSWPTRWQLEGYAVYTSDLLENYFDIILFYIYNFTVHFRGTPNKNCMSPLFGRECFFLVKSMEN